ncbi:MAG: Uma2 family endonuclease [Thermomicrobiales bacterium]
MSITTRPLTYHDLLQMPDDGKRYEIIDGELYVSPAPTPKHQELSQRLSLLIGNHVNNHRLGKLYTAPLDVRLGDHDIVEPDLLFISRERMDIIGATTINGAPDLVIEVLSPSTRSRDETLKADLYARSGVREYWLVDPMARTLVIRVLEDGRWIPAGPADQPESRVLAGLIIDLNTLFADVS